MAPERKRTTRLGAALRAARDALSLNQKAFGAMLSVSARTLSRWENGRQPTSDEAERILDRCEAVPDNVFLALADALGVESPVVAAAAPVVATPVAPPRSPEVELRAALDAIVYAASEERDVLPRHLRAFGVELLQGAARLGLSVSEAARLVAVRERTKVKAGDETA